MEIEKSDNYITYYHYTKIKGSQWAETFLDLTEKPTVEGWRSLPSPHCSR